MSSCWHHLLLLGMTIAFSQFKRDQYVLEVMNVMEFIEQRVIDGLRDLPPSRQEEVLDFVEFLKNKSQLQADIHSSPDRSKSAFEAAGELIGLVEGPEDLATNPIYLEGFGQS